MITNAQLLFVPRNVKIVAKMASQVWLGVGVGVGVCERERERERERKLINSDSATSRDTFGKNLSFAFL